MKNSKSINKQSAQLINVYSNNNIGDAAIYASFADMAGRLNIQLQQIETRQEKAQQIDAYISVGGDIFNNARPQIITRQFFKNAFQLASRPKQTIVFGQSIPRSCRGLAFRGLAHIFSKLSSVCVRDVESFKKLRAVKVNAKLSFDTVFSQELNSDWLANIHEVADKSLDFSEVALISLRPFNAMYQYNTHDCVKKLSKLCQLLNSQGYKPVVMVHSKVNENDTDMQMVRAIKENCVIDTIDPFFISEAIQRKNKSTVAPWQVAMAITALSELVIGIRYHSSVFRLASGKLPFNVFYSNKGQDLCDRLNVPGVSIQQFHPEKHLPEILATAGRLFDNQSIAQQVRQDFAEAIKQTTSDNSVSSHSLLAKNKEVGYEG